MSSNDRKRSNNDGQQLADNNNKRARTITTTSSSSSSNDCFTAAYHAGLGDGGGGGFKICVYCDSVYVPIDKGITFDCNHFACNHCAYDYIKSIIKLSTTGVSSINNYLIDGYTICPAKGCRRGITLEQARYITLELGHDDDEPQVLWRSILLIMLAQLEGYSSTQVVTSASRLLPTSSQVTVSSTASNEDGDVIDLDNEDDDDCDTKKKRKLINKIKEEIQLATLASSEGSTQGWTAARNNRTPPNCRRDCPLCLEKDIPTEDGVRLSCDHFMCITCAREYIKSRIMDAQVRDDEFICPMPKCNIPIGVQQAEYIIMDSTAAAEAIEDDDDAKGIWEKFLDFRFKHVFQTSDKKDGDFIECPHPGCEYAFLVENKNDMDSTCQCPLCKKSFCPKCYFIGGHTGMSCEAVEAAEQKEEEATDALAKDKGWRKCPVCGVIVSKEHGCNFMWCSSPQCRNKTNFCYVCGDKLTRDQHYSHFPKGPYENCCDKADLRQQQQKQQGKKQQQPPKPRAGNKKGKNNNAVNNAGQPQQLNIGGNMQQPPIGVHVKHPAVGAGAAGAVANGVGGNEHVRRQRKVRG